ncbi:TetR family transcriptional regulator [Aestuariicella hydrocarbonica]|uniref:TetR family transcriptional regulator n=1 Tax=Pseudomaricurvus hydrocarbonicus TaxID=1470433 RepID=A0A9E5MHQ0_9GAMM|nr:TetR family transcriptional regulator C-terminal domain-containing protein [Aestuariicella hydrocarbonica]NHO66231.1 TetR family transcriptional regulator [Aestuariicella hydrocarbonica]
MTRGKKYQPGKIRERNIEQILNAAEQEFVLHGFKGASTQAIAERAGLPKANLHYYFKNKLTLYNAVLENIIDLWNSGLQDITAADDPAEVIEKFIRFKARLSFTHPRASKIFATEIIQGAPQLKEHLRTDQREWVKTRTQVIHTWIEAGKMRPIDPANLIFLIWGATQHYADFDCQVLTVINKAEYDEEYIEHVSQQLCEIIMLGCGLTPSHLK